MVSPRERTDIIHGFYFHQHPHSIRLATSSTIISLYTMTLLHFIFVLCAFFFFFFFCCFSLPLFFFYHSYRRLHTRDRSRTLRVGDGSGLKERLWKTRIVMRYIHARAATSRIFGFESPGER